MPSPKPAQPAEPVVVRSELPLAALTPDPSWEGRRVAVAVPRMGRYRDLAPHLPAWRRVTLAVHLPATTGGVADLRILSSLGVTTCAVMVSRDPARPLTPDWEGLTDLVSYAVLGKAPHAPIHPFSYVADRWSSTARVAWEHLFLEPPPRPDGAAASLEPWRAHFLGDSPCAACEGFRVCLGALAAASPGGRPGPDAPCRALALELLAVSEEALAVRSAAKGGAPWPA